MPARLPATALAAFLDRLAQTGNIAMAARDTGISRAAIFKHRAANPAFATRCTAALTIFRASAAKPSPPEGEGDSRVERERGEGATQSHPHTHKTKGGELRLHQSRNRPPQLRRAQPGHLSPAGVAAFLGSLSATANIRLSAESVGINPASAHARRRRDPAFAQAWDEALQLGCERLTLATFERTRAFLEGRDTPSPAWEQTGETLDPPCYPEPRLAPITMMDALSLLTHHRNKVRRHQSEPVIKRQTLQELKAGLLLKVAAVKRRSREEGWE